MSHGQSPYKKMYVASQKIYKYIQNIAVCMFSQTAVLRKKIESNLFSLIWILTEADARTVPIAL